jgi:hypothetical protein
LHTARTHAATCGTGWRRRRGCCGLQNEPLVVIVEGFVPTHRSCILGELCLQSQGLLDDMDHLPGSNLTITILFFTLRA